MWHLSHFRIFVCWTVLNKRQASKGALTGGKGLGTCAVEPWSVFSFLLLLLFCSSSSPPPPPPPPISQLSMLSTLTETMALLLGRSSDTPTHGSDERWCGERLTPCFSNSHVNVAGSFSVLFQSGLIRGGCESVKVTMFTCQSSAKLFFLSILVALEVWNQAGWRAGKMAQFLHGFWGSGFESRVCTSLWSYVGGHENSRKKRKRLTQTTYAICMYHTR